MSAAITTPKQIVTTRPDVVRWLSIFMQSTAPAASVAQIKPLAQDTIGVVDVTHAAVGEVVGQYVYVLWLVARQTRDDVVD